MNSGSCLGSQRSPIEGPHFQNRRSTVPFSWEKCDKVPPRVPFTLCHPCSSDKTLSPPLSFTHSVYWSQNIINPVLTKVEQVKGDTRRTFTSLQSMEGVWGEAHAHVCVHSEKTWRKKKHGFPERFPEVKYLKYFPTCFGREEKGLMKLEVKHTEPTPSCLLPLPRSLPPPSLLLGPSVSEESPWPLIDVCHQKLCHLNSRLRRRSCENTFERLAASREEEEEEEREYLLWAMQRWVESRLALVVCPWMLLLKLHVGWSSCSRDVLYPAVFKTKHKKKKKKEKKKNPAWCVSEADGRCRVLAKQQW